MKNVSDTITAKLPLHPDYPKRGNRVHVLEPIEGQISLNLSRNDLSKLKKDKLVRLMGIANVKITCIGDEIEAEYHSEDYQIARDQNAPFLNWLPYGEGVEAKVVMPDASEAVGLVEKGVLELQPDNMFQFERFGYCRVENIKPFTAFFTHN